MFVLLRLLCLCVFFFFFKQKTAYELRISDLSSDVCSSDLGRQLSGLAGSWGQFHRDEGAGAFHGVLVDLVHDLRHDGRYSVKLAKQTREQMKCGCVCW